MIARLWRGVAANEADAEAYAHHLRANVVPALEAIEGFRGVRLLRRADGGGIECLVMTEWESMAAIRAFAGEHPERAVVEPEARAVLERFDDFVRHYEVQE